MSRREFAERLNMPAAATTMVRYESGDREPPGDFVAAVSREFGVDLQWLLTGDGSAPTAVADAPDETPPAQPADNIARIPLLAPRVGAGDGDDGDDQIAGHFSIDRSVTARLPVAEKRLRAALVRGDSMEPWVHDGDVVLFDRDPEARDAVCVVSVRGAVQVKRIQDVDGDRLRIISDNPAYAPREVGPEDDVRVIGRVVWRGQMGVR
jgi:phage repressor protein C with HTH and peptisase S24 domain